MSTSAAPSVNDALHARATRKALLRLIPVLGLLYFMSYVDRTVVALAKTDLHVDVGISVAAYGLGAGLFFLTYALLEVPSNLLMYRVGPRVWIARIAVSWGLITALSTFIQGESSFYGLRLLLGAAEAGLFPAILYIITQWFAQKDRALAVGYVYLAPSLAAVLGGPVGGALMQLDGIFGLQGWQWMFLVLGTVTMAIGVAGFVVLPNRPQDAQWLSIDEARILTERAAGEDDSTTTVLRGSLRKAFGRPSIAALSFVYFLGATAVGGLAYNIPSIIASLGTVGSLQIGLLTGLTGAGSVLGALLLPRIHRRWNTNTVATIAVLMAAGSLISAAILLIDSAPVRIVLMTSLGFCYAGATILIWTIAMEHITGVIAAATLAFVNTVGLLGGFFGPYIFGLIESAHGNPIDGFYVTMIASALIIIFTPILSALVTRERKQRARRIETETLLGQSRLDT